MRLVTKLVLEDRAAFQMQFHKLEKLADKNHVKFNKGKHEVWHWERIYSTEQDVLRLTCW